VNGTIAQERFVRVIDFHLHIGPIEKFTPCTADYFREHNAAYCERFGEQITPEGVIEFLKSQGVDKGVMLSEYAPKCSGVVTNEFTAEFCKGHSELIPFACLCFYDPTPFLEQARFAVEKLGMKGFKLLPSYQFFYPGDPALHPFYEYIQSLGLPVMFHTGSSLFTGTRIKYADPLLLEEVADDFPRLKIIMEHGGRPFWYDRAAWLVTKFRNVHVGTAGIPVKQWLKHFPHLERYPDRFIFGSDWPGIADLQGLIARVIALPVSEEIKEMILFRNAERMLDSTGPA